MIRNTIDERAMLRDLIRKMLLLEEKFQMGDALEEEEEEAREELFRLELLLTAHDEEVGRREAFVAKAAELGFAPSSSSKAVKNLRSQPEYSFRPSLANAKTADQTRKNLAARVDKARRDYDAFISFERSGTSRSGTQSLPPQHPKPGSKVYFLIEQVEPLRWYSWKDPRWTRSLKNTSFGSAKDRTGDEISGTGPGEERLAKIFGGKVQGGGVSFDIVTPDGSKWEVKALETAYVLIRPGTEGRIALASSMKRLDAIIKQIRNFTRVSKKLKHEMLTTDSEQLAIMRYVEGFLTDESEMIMKGEIPKERWREIMKVLRGLARLKKEWESDNPGAQSVETRIGLNDRDVKVDKNTFIDVAKRVQKYDPNLDLLDRFEERELAISTLRDMAFVSPTEFINDWFNSIDVETVFSQVDGIFVVNSQGFNLVPRKSFKKALRLTTISQAVPKFRFVYHGGGQTSSDSI